MQGRQQWLRPASSASSLHMQELASCSTGGTRLRLCCSSCQGLQEKYQLKLPQYPGTACCVRLGGSEPSTASTSTRQPAANGHSNGTGGGSVADMRQNYDRGGLTEADALPDPLKMFDR